MAEFECNIVEIDDVFPNPNADRLSVVAIGGYRCISGKLADGSPRYKKGDHVIYVPEGAVLPEYLLKREGFWDEANNKGLLAGSDGNRVKAVKLRGVISQGILIGDDQDEAGRAQYLDREIQPLGVDFNRLGKDVKDQLGIKKYEPVIPTSMSGQVVHITGIGLKFDIENGQKYTNIFDLNDKVVVTEKLHGTFCAITYHKEYGIFTYSKGLGSQDLVFQNTEENKQKNVYVKYLQENEFLLHRFNKSKLDGWDQLTILGELSGKGIQDLHYGSDKPFFRVFDIHMKVQGLSTYFNWDELEQMTEFYGLKTVPVLFKGKWHELLQTADSGKTELEEYRDSKDSISGSHVREGIVVKIMVPEFNDLIGRKMVKYVSPSYLLRKGNCTEYQ